MFNIAEAVQLQQSIPVVIHRDLNAGVVDVLFTRLSGANQPPGAPPGNSKESTRLFWAHHPHHHKYI